MVQKTIGIFVLILLLVSAIIVAEEYTRERSERLHDLIKWYEYSPLTFEHAIKEQKPIYLVLSAPSWCYWCHVYESEDYLFHPDFYPYINEHFIPVFIDSDRRPDLTKKYLEGGWPSTTILTPNMQRIVGFTGPRDIKGLRTYLESVIEFLKDKEFTGNGTDINYNAEIIEIPTIERINFIEENILSFIVSSYDSKLGGIGVGDLPDWREGQKFPKPLAHKILLDKYIATGNQEYLKIVKFTFENQYTELTNIKTEYRLYDPIEGGFHRYSTKRDWTIPHYEKMLIDQAKFVMVLQDLYEITKDDKVKIALEGTLKFVENKFSDPEGGFYASQDAHLEEEYFGNDKIVRSQLEQPYVDKIRQMDSNGLMISSLLYIYNKTGNEKAQDLSRKSLEFIKSWMVGNAGIYYYYDFEDNKPVLTGLALANSFGLMAFLDGYEYVDSAYLQTAESIANYSLANLYDWESGAFFERNSKDIDYYAPNERIELEKPYLENSVFANSMLRLYLVTGNLEYLEAGMKSFGFVLQKIGGLDDSYFVIKTANLVREHNLINIYAENNEELNNIIKKGRNGFFLYEVLNGSHSLSSLQNAPKLQSNLSSAAFYVIALLAFLAGFISFLSPCTLPVLTAYFAGAVNADKGKIFRDTIFFILGLALVFSIFGMGATIVGGFFKANRVVFTRIAGSLIIGFGIMQLLGKGFSGLNFKFRGKKTPLGNFIFGMLFALGWSACIGPILASILLISSTTSTAFQGSILLFIYALGLGVPLIIFSLIFDKIRHYKFWKILHGKMISFRIMGKEFNIHSTSLITGVILIFIGLLIFNDYLFTLNKYSLQASYVQNIILNGENYLKTKILGL